MQVRHKKFFLQPSSPRQRQYEALRAYFVDNRPIEQIVKAFGYTKGSFAVLCTHFRQGKLPPFFIEGKPGPKNQPKKNPVKDLVIALRKKNYSIYDIHRILKEKGHRLSARGVWEILQEVGFARLPRRLDEERPKWPKPLAAPRANIKKFLLRSGQTLETNAAGIFLFVPTLVELDFPSIVQKAACPGTKMVPPLAYVLSLLSLKLIGKERISHVMDICHDQGLGCFVGLNAIPKTTALTTYSYQTHREHNLAFLQALIQNVRAKGYLPGESINLDFHSIPHFGDQSILEKNYVPRRSHAEKSIAVFIAQDATTRALCYSNARVLKKDQSDEVLKFVSFWQHSTGNLPKELVFDSRLTNVQNLNRLNAMGVRFLTLRRRSEGIISSLMSLPKASWSPCRLDVPHRKYRDPLINESRVSINGYEAPVRQIAAKGLGRELPTVLITNNFHSKPSTLLTRYAQRMIIENAIADGVNFFHLDALCSSIQIEVDFSVALTVAANLLYRLFAFKIRGFEDAQPKQIYRKFINTMGSIQVQKHQLVVHFPRRAHNPLLVEAGYHELSVPVPWMHNYHLRYNFK
jgi:hypothetical protein